MDMVGHSSAVTEATFYVFSISMGLNDAMSGFVANRTWTAPAAWKAIVEIVQRQRPQRLCTIPDGGVKDRVTQVKAKSRGGERPLDVDVDVV